jgi:hypothetical protein
MPDRSPPDPDTYSEAETVARREATLKTLLATPPKPLKAIPKKRRESRGK